MPRKSSLSTASRARADRQNWSPEKVAEVCGYVEEHLDLATACEKAGLTYEGLYNAMCRDESIRVAIRKAQAASAHALITHALASPGAEAKAPLWLLERQQRERYKPPKAEVEQKTENTGTVGPTVVVQIADRGERRAILQGAPARVIEADVVAEGEPGDDGTRH